MVKIKDLPKIERPREKLLKYGAEKLTDVELLAILLRTGTIGKSGGRMAIVLPQGDLNNSNAQFVREWIIKRARILAVVGLGVNTFKPFTGTKTSVLFLQKWREDEKSLEDYPIFMAVSEKSGKDSSGDYIYKDIDGKKVIDHDLNEIADEFVKFAKKQKFNFWKD